MKTLEERFWSKVEKTESCWIWIGGKRDGLYGSIGLGGKGAPNISAHRMSWELHYGKIPDGMLVCHHCDNPPCVRPDHLFVGTVSDNNKDSANKGRNACNLPPQPTGEMAHRSKLTLEQVRQMRSLYASGINRFQISKMFPMVRHAAIYRIFSGHTWVNDI